MHMEEALADFLRYLALEKNASTHTVKSYREDLTQALEFFRTRPSGQALQPTQLTTRLLRAYLAWLHEQGYAKTTMARRIARENGLRYVFTGNVHDAAGQSTYCHGCGAVLIGRDWYDVTAWSIAAAYRYNGLAERS